jgi:hypothetical protein
MLYYNTILDRKEGSACLFFLRSTRIDRSSFRQEHPAHLASIRTFQEYRGSKALPVLAFGLFWDMLVFSIQN